MTTYSYTGRKARVNESHSGLNVNAVAIIVFVVIIAAAGLYYLMDMRYRILISKLDNINSRQTVLDDKMVKLEERINENSSMIDGGISQADLNNIKNEVASLKYYLVSIYKDFDMRLVKAESKATRMDNEIAAVSSYIRQYVYRPESVSQTITSRVMPTVGYTI